jgi:hypothetical protein
MEKDNKNEKANIDFFQNDIDEEAMYKFTYEDKLEQQAIEEFARQDAEDALELLEREFLEREEERIEQELKEELLKKKKVSKEEHRKIKQEAEKAERLYTVDKFVKLAELHSYENTIPAKMIYHYILGQLLKDNAVYDAKGKPKDSRIHGAWFQDSGSGKGELMRFAYDILDGLLYVGGVNTDINGIRFPVGTPIKLKEEEDVAQLDSNTSASLLNDWEYDNKKKKYAIGDEGEPLPKYGVLANKKYLWYEEASPLFDSRGNIYSINMPEIFIKIMEPIGTESHVYYRSLKGYPKRCPTISNASIFLMSRPIEGMVNYVIESGMLQRMLFYYRELADTEREKMDEKVALRSIGTAEDAVDIQKKISEIKQELIDIQVFVKSRGRIDFDMQNKEEILSYLIDRMKWFKENVKTTSVSKRHIINDYVSRYPHFLKVLALHMAATRKSNYIEKTDIEYAFNLLKPLYESLVKYIETKVGRDYLSNKERAEKEVLKNNINKKGIVKKELIRVLTRELLIGRDNASTIIEKYLAAKLIWENDDGLIFLN